MSLGELENSVDPTELDPDAELPLFRLLENASPQILKGVTELCANLKTLKLNARSGKPSQVTITLDQIAAAKYLLARAKNQNMQGLSLVLQDPQDPSSFTIDPLEGGSTKVGHINKGKFVLTEEGKKDQVSALRVPTLRDLRDSPLRVSPHVRIVEGRGKLSAAVHDIMGPHLDAALISGVPATELISGTSGSGKTTFARSLVDELGRMGVSARVIAGDDALGTLRGDLRVQKDSLPGHLSRWLYALTEQTLLTALYVIASNGQAIDLNIPRKYERKKGEAVIGEGKLSFKAVTTPEHVVLVEGSDASELMRDLAILDQLLGLSVVQDHLWEVLPANDVETVQGMVAQALQNAVNRGLAQGQKEISYSNPWVGEMVAWMAPTHLRAIRRAQQLVLPSAS